MSRQVKSIRVNYTDGGREAIQRGFVGRPDPERGENSWVIDFVGGVTAEEVKQILANFDAMIDKLRAQVEMMDTEEMSGSTLNRLYIGGDF